MVARFFKPVPFQPYGWLGLLALGFFADVLLDLGILRTAQALTELLVSDVALWGPAGVLLVVLLLGLAIGSRLHDRRTRGPAAIERSFFWAHSTPAVLCDRRSGLIREANVAASQLFGLTREDFEDLPLQRLFVDDSAALVRLGLTSQERVQAEGYRKLPSGGRERRQLRLSAFPLRASGCDEVALCCEDVTESHAIQQLLQRFQATQQAFLSSLPVPAGLYDSGGQLVFSNTCFEREVICRGLSDHCPHGSGAQACVLQGSSLDSLVRMQVTAVCATTEIKAMSLDLGTCGAWEIRLFPVLAEEGLMVGLIGINLKEAEQARKKAEDYAVLLRALATRALHMREAERAELAREIHDLIGQEVAVMTLDVSRLHRLFKHPDEAAMAKASDIAKKIEQGVSTIMTTVRRLATTLRPELLNTLGLAEAASSLVSEMQARTGIRASLLVDDGWLDPTDGAALQLYRCLQEALTNITKHAQASRVLVNLRLEPMQRVMIIEDNGQGIGPRPESDVTHLGLVGMSERVLSIQGRLTIKTRPDFPGTMIWIEVPLEPTERGKNQEHGVQASTY